MRRRRFSDIALALALLLIPSVAAAQGKKGPTKPDKTDKTEKADSKERPSESASAAAASDLAKAEKLYAELDYDPAAALGQTVLERGGLKHEELVRALRIVALAKAGHDQEDAAREAFVTLLGYEPDYQVDPNLGPRVTTPFFSARGYWRGQSQRPGIDLTAEIKAETGGTLRATVRDPLHLVKKTSLSWRWAGKGDFEATPLPSVDGGAVEVGAAPPLVSRLEYFATAFDAKGNEIFEAGSEKSPKIVLLNRVAGAEKKPTILSSPIFWIAAGAAVVAGGATAGYFIFRDRTPTTASVQATAFCANGPSPAPCN